jgi:uncharacterized protein DUF4411
MDSSAINLVAAESSNYNAAFERLTDLVKEAELTFCDQVVIELERTAEGDPGPLWATTVKDRRVDTGASYSTQRWVLSNVSDIVDPDDSVDAAPYVVAQAKSLQDQGEKELNVVTEDIADKPTRRSILSVCQQLGIPCIRVAEMMRSCEHPWP